MTPSEEDFTLMFFIPFTERNRSIISQCTWQIVCKTSREKDQSACGLVNGRSTMRFYKTRTNTKSDIHDDLVARENNKNNKVPHMPYIGLEEAFDKLKKIEI